VPHRDENDPDGEEREDGIHVDIGLSVSDLLGGLLGGSSSSVRGRPEGRPNGPRNSEPPSRDTQPSSTSEGVAAGDYHVETYQEDEQMTVVADLPGVDPDDVSAGVQEGTNDLVILVAGDVVERVAVPWDLAEVLDATFNNGVLHIQLQAVGESVE
jgi:HSP20 family molecular chaperone IbpA